MQKCTSGNGQYWAFLLGSSKNKFKRLVPCFKKYFFLEYKVQFQNQENTRIYRKRRKGVVPVDSLEDRICFVISSEKQNYSVYLKRKDYVCAYIHKGKPVFRMLNSLKAK